MLLLFLCLIYLTVISWKTHEQNKIWEEMIKLVICWRFCGIILELHYHFHIIDWIGNSNSLPKWWFIQMIFFKYKQISLPFFTVNDSLFSLRKNVPLLLPHYYVRSKTNTNLKLPPKMWNVIKNNWPQFSQLTKSIKKKEYLLNPTNNLLEVDGGRQHTNFPQKFRFYWKF